MWLALILPGILLGSINPYEIESFFDLVSLTDDWTHCCNDMFLPDWVWEQVRQNRETCLERHPDNIVCFDTCFLVFFKILDRRYGFSREAIDSVVGSDIVLGDENDWKKNVTDRFVTECIDEVGLQTGPSPQCNVDARKLANCYSKKMFDACPVELGGGTCSYK